MKCLILLFALILAVYGAEGEEAGGVIAKPGAPASQPALGHLNGVQFLPLFPENERNARGNLKFTAGEQAELCLGFVNGLDRHVNFTSIEASFRSVATGEFVQNVSLLA